MVCWAEFNNSGYGILRSRVGEASLGLMSDYMTYNDTKSSLGLRSYMPKGQFGWCHV
jgi:hypothetical protein